MKVNSADEEAHVWVRTFSKGRLENGPNQYHKKKHTKQTMVTNPEGGKERGKKIGI